MIKIKSTFPGFERPLTEDEKVKKRIACFDASKIKFGNRLSELEKSKLTNIFENHKQAISWDMTQIGRTNLIEFDIELADEIPVNIRQFPLTDADEKEAMRQILDWLKAGIVKEGHSRYNSPALFAEKKTIDPKTGKKERRLCVNYRKINSKMTGKTQWPLPRIDQIFQRIGAHNKYFTSLDFMAAFQQVPLTETAKEKTAFTICGRQFVMQVCPFGLSHIPGNFQRYMQILLTKMVDEICRFVRSRRIARST